MPNTPDKDGNRRRWDGVTMPWIDCGDELGVLQATNISWIVEIDLGNGKGTWVEAFSNSHPTRELAEQAAKGGGE